MFGLETEENQDFQAEMMLWPILRSKWKILRWLQWKEIWRNFEHQLPPAPWNDLM